jgi:diguanylate cyclase (GGDEF)-like protein/PAS domain S-box-containing protein
VNRPSSFFETALFSPPVVSALYLKSSDCGTGNQVGRLFADERIVGKLYFLQSGRQCVQLGQADRIRCREPSMMDRTELLESALDNFSEGIALLDRQGMVAFWNRAAAAITGYTCLDVMGRPALHGMEELEPERLRQKGQAQAVGNAQSGRGVLAKVQHKLGHGVLTIARVMVLRDDLGTRIGEAVVFHPAESLDALPHGIGSDDGDVGASRADLEDELQSEFDNFLEGELPFGILWIAVDQAEGLRKTHGLGACEAMLEKVQRVIAHGLRPTEIMGRWSDDEFLVISHERTAGMLGAHAQALAGLARTTDFRWWGDRVSITVSIGAAQARPGEDKALKQVVERAQKAMETSMRAGGNTITSATGGLQCLPS